jgi:carbamoyl-phosphate synthase large subunit
VARDGDVLADAISEHVENAGVHSGDATLVTRPQRTYLETIRRIRRLGRQIADALGITGPFNIQFIAQGTAVKVIECNLRASRSFPFVSKVYKYNLVDLATRVIMGAPVDRPTTSFMDLDYVGVKAPQFSFTRLEGADPRALHAHGVRLFATRGTAEFMKQFGLDLEVLHWPLERTSLNVLDALGDGSIDLVINIPKNYQEEELTNDYIIRRKAVDFAIPLITDVHLAQRFAEALVAKRLESLAIKSWDEYR